MQIDLTDAEFEVLAEVFGGYGSDCPPGDYRAVQALAEKLGIWEPESPYEYHHEGQSELHKAIREVTIGNRTAYIGQTVRIRLASDFRITTKE